MSNDENKDIQTVRDQMDKVLSFIGHEADELGGKIRGNNKKYKKRKNASEEAIKNGGAYLGLIRPEEEEKGPYHDFSFVIFPSKYNDFWILTIGVGTLGFKNDLKLAYQPGMKRLFRKLIDSESGFIKHDLADLEIGIPQFFKELDDIEHLVSDIEKKYGKYLPICQVIKNPLLDDGKKNIRKFLAAYAKMRGWDNFYKYSKEIEKVLSIYRNEELSDQEEVSEVDKLLQQRKYIILEGPPGTGKTRLAKKLIPENNVQKENIFFTQFHAETSYSDFVYGIMPSTKKESLLYRDKEGVFLKAIKKACDSKEPVFLIIDEINRANLSNILGPVFYLFEYQMKESDVLIEVASGFEIDQLPTNFYVIGTMNTADRSLAVVDFALRRRFAWYYMKPRTIENSPIGLKFFKNHFDKFASIFEWHANSEELNLQPGQGYFLAENNDKMRLRIKYELLPLIREYLRAGYLSSAIDEFNNYFMKQINEPIFE